MPRPWRPHRRRGRRRASGRGHESVERQELLDLAHAPVRLTGQDVGQEIDGGPLGGRNRSPRGAAPPRSWGPQAAGEGAPAFVGGDRSGHEVASVRRRRSAGTAETGVSTQPQPGHPPLTGCAARDLDVTLGNGASPIRARPARNVETTKKEEEEKNRRNTTKPGNQCRSRRPRACGKRPIFSCPQNLLREPGCQHPQH